MQRTNEPLIDFFVARDPLRGKLRAHLPSVCRPQLQFGAAVRRLTRPSGRPSNGRAHTRVSMGTVNG